MKCVKYVGDDSKIRKGSLAMMRDDGKVQLDGPKAMWRAGALAREFHPLCFGWHEANGEDWIEE